MPKEAYVYRIILSYLEKTVEPIYTSELVNECKIPYSTVARVIRRLTKEKRVKRLPGEANSFKYKFITYELPVDASQLSHSISKAHVIEPKKIPAEMLLATAHKWANDGWSPALLNSTKGVLSALSELYRWALLSSTGQQITDNELKTPYDKLLFAKNEATKFLEFVTGLMTTKELWDGKTFAFFLLKDVTDTDSVKDLAEGLRTQSKH